MKSFLSIRFQNLLLLLAGMLFLSSARGAKNPDYCWFPSPYSTYDQWMNAGKTAKSSKRKICCFSRAIALADTKAKKAEAYFQRGYAKYYYMLDATGETRESSSTGPKDQIIDDETGKDLQEEALVPRDTRRETGFSDYQEALKLDSSHSDSYFECGVYWYWKGYREEAKEHPDQNTVSDAYNKALYNMTECIRRDKWCSTAYEIRSRIRERLGQQSLKTRDLEIRDKLRLHDDPASGSGLTGYYSVGRNFTALVSASHDSQVAFDWGKGGTGAGVGEDGFCIRWIGTINPPSDGSYLFSTCSDDGVRLWIDNELLINNWSDHSSTRDTSRSISLKKNQHAQVVLEYFENTGHAVIYLYWTPPGGQEHVIPSKYLYPVPSPEASRFPVFFQHGMGDYTGWHLYLDKGNVKFNLGDFKNNLSHVFVPGLYNVRLYDNENYSGKTAFVSGLCSQNLNGGQGVYFNDITSSAKVECKPGFGE